jgi:cytochrome P450
VTLFTVGPNFLRVCMITAYPSFYFSDQEWRKLRKLVSPAFSSSTVDVYFDVFKNNAEILVQILKTKVGAGEVDVCPYLNLFALDSIIGEYNKCHLRKFRFNHSVVLTVTSIAIHELCGK